MKYVFEVFTYDPKCKCGSSDVRLLKKGGYRFKCRRCGLEGTYKGDVPGAWRSWLAACGNKAVKS